MRNIDLNIIEVSETCVFTVKNTHRNEELTNNGASFLSNNGIKFSVDYPDWYRYDKTIYVQGRKNHLDDEKIEATVEEFQQIREAVDEYNAAFGFRPILTV